MTRNNNPPFALTVAEKLIGPSSEMCELREKLIRMTADKGNIFISGETGTGKEIAATLIAGNSTTGGEIINVNCALLRGPLSDSELFGHMKGSFSGADYTRRGLVELADRKVLFLDEIEELDYSTQAKLLRFMENGEYRRLGSGEIRHSRCRVIAATNENVTELFSSQRMRRDFFMRICMQVLRVPPLRERMEDIPYLVAHKEKLMKAEKHITDFRLFFEYSWPGNVRELFNVVERVHYNDPEGLLATEELINPLLMGI